jgi:hypothetical protein
LSETTGGCQVCVFPANDGAFRFVNTFKNAPVFGWKQQRSKDIVLAVFPVVGVQAVAGYGKVRDGRYLKKGQRLDVEGVFYIEYVDACILFHHEKKRIQEYCLAGFPDFLRRQVGDVVQGGQGSVYGAFALAVVAILGFTAAGQAGCGADQREEDAVDMQKIKT